MRNLRFRSFLSALALYSIVMAVTTTVVKAVPVQFNQVVQVVNAKPGKANTSGFAQLRLAGDDLVLTGDDTKKTVPPVQDDRVITETRSEIIEEEVCDCAPLPVVAGGGFPYWTLGFAAVPLIFLIPPGDDDPDDTPTPTTTPPSPTETPTPPLPPPPPPPPTPEPVPEPMTILLFGTGLASIGLAARRRFGRKNEGKTEE